MTTLIEKLDQTLYPDYARNWKSQQEESFEHSGHRRGGLYRLAHRS